MKTHPIADVFPMMNDGRYAELLADIREHGLRVPIVLYEGMILDGRNRHKACTELGIEPRFEDFAGGNPWKCVWSLNGSRRDLDQIQHGLIYQKIARGSAEWEARRQRVKAAGDEKRSAKAKAQHEVSTPRHGETMVVAQDDQPPKVPHSRIALASEAGVSPGTQKGCNGSR